ncbi:MAG: hypothetical protein FJX18_02050 [Alphaproteobacteria bacterium]|nr:hypothetical protein [Alphaproteobacteria bacterium]
MRILFLCFLFVQSLAISATNPQLDRGLALAKSDILVGEVDEGSWAAFLKYAYENPIPSTETQPAFEKLRAQNRNAAYFKEQIIALFEAWLRAKAIAEATHVDDDFREYHGLPPDSATTSPARSGVGAGSVRSEVGGAGRGSVHRSTALSREFSVGASTMGAATDQVTGLLERLRTLREAADLKNPISAANRASEMNKARGEIREANLKAFLEEDTLRASYIKVLLEDATHRGEVLAAINAPANAGFRTALIDALLRNPAVRAEVLAALHTSHSGEMITKLHEDTTRPALVDHLSTNHPNDMIAKVVESHHLDVIAALIPTHIADFTALLGTNEPFRDAMLDGLLTGHRDTLLTRLGMGTLDERINNLVVDVPNRQTIAQAFVDSADFRNVLIARLEAGHHAINATRMLWHPIDGADPHAAFWGALGNDVIVTKVAFDHLLGKTRDGYQAISHLTGQRGNFRDAFEASNQVGKDRTHLGSTAR